MQTGWTLLHLACWYGLPDAVQTLVLAGHDPTKKDWSGRVAREVAEQCKFQDCADLLTDSNDDISKSLFYQRNKALLDETQQSTEMTNRSVAMAIKAEKPHISFDYEN